MLVKDISSRFEKLNHEKIACVYFLVYKEHIMYVGKTINLNIRIDDHRRTPKALGRLFDEVYYLRFPKDFPEEEICRIEKAYIRFLKPLYNKERNLWNRDWKYKMSEEDLAIIDTYK